MVPFLKSLLLWCTILFWNHSLNLFLHVIVFWFPIIYFC
jgi:hypothetical protein